MIAVMLLAIASDPLPRDVDQFITRYEACMHFRGEEPYDAARRREIERGIKKSCTALDRRRARLVMKYRDDPRVRAVLVEHPVEE